MPSPRYFNIIEHPVRMGLLWALLFCGLMAGWGAAFDDQINWLAYSVMAILAIPGGIAWGYLMKWYFIVIRRILARKVGNAR